MDKAKESLAWRAKNEPSNLDVIAAFSPSDHLELFHLGNKANDKLWILASSRNNAKIIALMGGHIRSTHNASFWGPLPTIAPRSALAQAIRARMPGVVWIRPGHVITRENIFYDPKVVAK